MWCTIASLTDFDAWLFFRSVEKDVQGSHPPKSVNNLRVFKTCEKLWLSWLIAEFFFFYVGKLCVATDLKRQGTLPESGDIHTSLPGDDIT